MNTNASPQEKPVPASPADRDRAPVQTGALPGGQPGQDANTPASKGQSNVDAAFGEGVDYGEHERRRR